MATFRTGQKTHQAVLPHPTRRPPPPSTDVSGAVLSALESESVDTPRIGHETGLRHHPRVVSGADHVRGETTDISPDVGGVTTRPQVGERPRERHPSVFVLDKNQIPLQPCHPARARKHTGIAVFTHQDGERHGRYGIQLDHRGAQIRKKPGQRSAHRRRRRTANLRHRAPRFANRTRPDKHGFPRLRLPRTKGFFGFATGDLVRAVVSKGRKAGVHTGRAAVRSSGRFNITTAQGIVQGIGHKHMRLLQRADGYGYSWKGEGVSSRL